MRAMELDDALASLKGRIDGMKKAVSEISDREQEFAAFMDSGKIAAALGALLLAFDENYARLKRRAGVLDFSDLEHKCLELLSLPHVRDEVRARYKYVFIDEYQDVNPVQEKILSLVAGENVFCVDVRGRTTLIVGNEGNGLSAESRRAAKLVSLPMRNGFESLNAAVAGSVIMYQINHKNMQ